MAKKENNTMAENTEEVKTEVKAPRERRLEISSILPDAENSFVGTIICTVLGLEDKPMTFTYAVVDQPAFFLQAIESGLKNRLATVAGGIKDSAILWDALCKEVENLKQGIFSVRKPASEKPTVFDSLILGLAMLSVTKDKKEFMNIFKAVEADTELLTKTKETFEALSDEEKKEVLDRAETKIAKKAAGTLKDLLAD